MVSSQTMAIIAGAAVLGGIYLTALRASSKMCSNPTAFNTQMGVYQAGCPTTTPSTFDVMKYFVL